MASRSSTTGEGWGREVLIAWAERCRFFGVDPANCVSVEARYLLEAVRNAVRGGGGTLELGRAARAWGGRFSAPVDALTSVSALREVLVESQGLLPGASNESWLPVPAYRFNRVADQLLHEAVDAASANLRAAARTDALTSCANRMALNEDLTRAAISAGNAGLDLAVAMVDLDGLKQINDTSGHEAGDLALIQLTGTLESVLRASDTLYRIGGDEFVVLAPFTDVAGAEAMLRRAGQLEGPPFSFGVASLAAVGAEAIAHPDLLLSAADAALYRARANRRAAPPSRAVPAAAAVATARRGRLAGVGAAGVKSAGFASAAAVMLAVVSAVGLGIALESQSTPKGIPEFNAPVLTAPAAATPSSHHGSGPQPGGSHPSTGRTGSSSPSGSHSATHSGGSGTGETTGRSGGDTTGTVPSRSGGHGSSGTGTGHSGGTGKSGSGSGSKQGTPPIHKQPPKPGSSTSSAIGPIGQPTPVTTPGQGTTPPNPGGGKGHGHGHHGHHGRGHGGGHHHGRGHQNQHGNGHNGCHRHHHVPHNLFTLSWPSSQNLVVFDRLRPARSLRALRNLEASAHGAGGGVWLWARVEDLPVSFRYWL
jgi:diguanylate cyclase (GGDEF)-like protein